MRTALSIAGSDSSGGAGIQADIKTMSANGIYAMSAITALTAQNTTGVTDILEVTPVFLSAQLDAVSIIRILMAQDVHFPAPLHRIWQRVRIWRARSFTRKSIFPARWLRCWTLERAEDR